MRARRAHPARAAHAPGRTVFPEREPAADIDLGDARRRRARARRRDARGGRRGRHRTDRSTSARGASATASGRHDGAVTGRAVRGGSDLLVTIGDDARALVWDLEAPGGRRDARADTRAACSRRRPTSHGAHAAHRGPRQPRHHLGPRRRPASRASVRRGPRRRDRGNFFPATAISADGRTLVTNAARRREPDRHGDASKRRSLPRPGRHARGRTRPPSAAGGIVVAGLDGFLAIVDARTGRLRAAPARASRRRLHASDRARPGAGS